MGGDTVDITTIITVTHFYYDYAWQGIRAAEKIKYPIPLVSKPSFYVADSVT